MQRRIARALGAALPEVIHHGLLLGEDGKKLSKRHGHASVADFREEGIPAAALRAYLDELGLPAHDVHLDRARIGRLAIEAIEAMGDEDLAAAAGAPPSAVRALRGARTLVEAREIGRQITSPASAALPEEAWPTLERFVELRDRAPDDLDEAGARAIVRELKAVGGDLRSLGWRSPGSRGDRSSGPSSLALPPGEALERVRRSKRRS